MAIQPWVGLKGALTFCPLRNILQTLADYGSLWLTLAYSGFLWFTMTASG